VWHVHLKDVFAVGEPHETCRWGEGIVDIEGCVRALQGIGYTGTIVVEHEPETFDPSAEIRSMREQLEGWLA
jgi:sugar phosphate isomerase/epimerase